MPSFPSSIGKIREGKEFQSAQGIQGYKSSPLPISTGHTDNQEGLPCYLDRHSPLETLFLSHKPEE